MELVNGSIHMPDNGTTGQTGNFTEPYFWEADFAMINLAVGNTIVGVLGLFGNILILFVLCQRVPRNSTDIYRINLAFADLVFTLVATIIRYGPLTLTGTDPLRIHPWACKIWLHMIMSFQNMSGWTVVCLTVERLIIVYAPLHSKTWITKTRAIIAIICFDIFFPLLYLPIYPVYGHKYKAVGPDKELVLVSGCAHMSDAPPGVLWYMQEVRPWIDATLCFLLPFVIILTSNCFIIYKMAKHAKFRAKSAITKDDPSEQNHVITVTLLVVSFVYMICVGPMRTMIIIDGHGPPFGMPVKTESEALVLLRWSFAINLSRLNYAINFILYCLCSAEFRKDVKFRMKKTLPCCFKPDGSKIRTSTLFSRVRSSTASDQLHGIGKDRTSNTSTKAHAVYYHTQL